MLHLYRVADYYDAFPNDYRVITAPVGDPIADLPDGFYSPLPPCPDCGGILEWAEAGRVPGWRQCADCGAEFTVTTAEMGAQASRMGMTLACAA